MKRMVLHIPRLRGNGAAFIRANQLAGRNHLCHMRVCTLSIIVCGGEGGYQAMTWMVAVHECFIK